MTWRGNWSSETGLIGLSRRASSSHVGAPARCSRGRSFPLSSDELSSPAASRGEKHTAPSVSPNNKHLHPPINCQLFLSAPLSRPHRAAYL